MMKGILLISLFLGLFLKSFSQDSCKNFKLDTTHYLILSLRVKHGLLSKKVEVLLPNHILSKNYEHLNWKRKNDSYYKAKEVLKVDEPGFKLWKRRNINKWKVSPFLSRKFRQRVLKSDFYKCDSISEISREVQFKLIPCEDYEGCGEKRRENYKLSKKFEKYISQKMKKDDVILDRIVDDEIGGSKKYVFLMKK